MSSEHHENGDKVFNFEKESLRADEDKKSGSKEKSFVDKLCHLKSHITVEPILAGMIIPSMLGRLAIQNLNLDKSCRVKLGFDPLICDSLIDRTGVNLTNYEGEVQKVVAAIESWKSIIQTAIPTILVILMGAWSDRSGNRKYCILMPIFGEFMVAISNIISTFFFYDIPVEVTMFFEGFFPAITGGWVMAYLGVFSYIGDVTTPEDRTFRLGLVNLCMTAGVPIGTALSGILLKILGYYGIFFLTAALYTMTFMYGYFCLSNNTKPGMDPNKKVEPVKISDVVTLVKETAEVATKKRDGNLRKKIISVLIIVVAIYGPNHGERVITYMYVRYKLKWDAVRYSIYSTYGIITHSLSALFSLSVFSRRLGFHDSMMCLISVVSKMAGSIMTGLVSTEFQMFMVPLVEILNATTFTSLRSMSSKLVPCEETGKMNSLFSLVETLAALVFDPLYSLLYFMTITSAVPGAVFFFSASMTLPPIAGLIWFFMQHRNELTQPRLEVKNEKQTDVPGEQLTEMTALTTEIATE